MQPASIKFLKLCLGKGWAQLRIGKGSGGWVGRQETCNPAPPASGECRVAGREHRPVDVTENQKPSVHDHPREVNSVAALSDHCSCPQNRGRVSSSCPTEGRFERENSIKTSECRQGHSVRLYRLVYCRTAGRHFSG